jgi:hypothetical protein
VDAHGRRVQVGQVLFTVFGLVLGVVLITDSRGFASRTLERLRDQPVTGRFYTRMPVWVMRAFGVWAILCG